MSHYRKSCVSPWRIFSQVRCMSDSSGTVALRIRRSGNWRERMGAYSSVRTKIFTDYQSCAAHHRNLCGSDLATAALAMSTSSCGCVATTSSHSTNKTKRRSSNYSENIRRPNRPLEPTRAVRANLSPRRAAQRRRWADERENITSSDSSSIQASDDRGRRQEF